jgi:DNA replication protein DnaC
MSNSPEICDKCGKKKEPSNLDLGFPSTGIGDLLLCNTYQCRLTAITEAIRKRDSEHPEIMLHHNGVPVHFHRSSFENYVGHTEVVEACREHVLSNDSLALSGGAGSGKTHLGVAILREKLIRYQQYSFLFVSAPRLILEFGQAIDKDSDLNENGVLKKFIECRTLLVDDLGNQSLNPWVVSKLYLIFDARYSENRQTIVTTNMSLDEIEKRIGSPIASRIAADRFISLNFPDYRRRRFRNDDHEETDTDRKDRHNP